MVSEPMCRYRVARGPSELGRGVQFLPGVLRESNARTDAQKATLT